MSHCEKTLGEGWFRRPVQSTGTAALFSSDVVFSQSGSQLGCDKSSSSVASCLSHFARRLYVLFFSSLHGGVAGLDEVDQIVQDRSLVQELVDSRRCVWQLDS